MTSLRTRFVAACLATAVPTALLLPATSVSAFADGQFSATLNAALGYAKNPFLLPGAPSSGYVELSIAPAYIISDEISRTLLDANYRRTEYFDRFGSSSGYGAHARHERSLSERVQIAADVAFDSYVTGERFPLVDFVDAPETPFPDLPDFDEDLDFDPDAPLLGLRQRRNSFRAGFDVAIRQTERDRLRAGASLRRITYPNSDFAHDFWEYGGSFGYDRIISPRTTVGALVTVDRVEFDRDAGGFTILRPQLTMTRQLSPLWTADVAAGGLWIDGRGPAGSRDSVGLFANVAACRKGERSDLCLNFSRDAGGSGTGDVRTILSGGASYTYRLTEEDRLTGTASYVRYSSDESDLPKSELFRTGIGYQRKIMEDVALGMESFYRNGSNGFTRNADDYGAQVTLTYRYEGRK